MNLQNGIGSQVGRDCLLSPMQLQRISEHKYSATDGSLLEPYMTKFWNRVVEKYPMWLAPNLITLIGFLCNITAILILSFYSPTGSQQAPRWAYALCAVTLFVYQTMDATDGKQARRTRSASPLGELFDHGCDSMSQMFVTLVICISVMLGDYPTVTLLSCISAVGMFYCAHWQTYVCGTLKFAKFDVTEAQFAVMALCLISAVFGPQFWKLRLLGKLELRVLLVLVSGIGGGLNLLAYFRTIFTGGIGKNGSTVADTSVLFPLFPLLTMVVPPVMIFCKSETGVFQSNLVLYCIMFGFISSKITNRLVIAHMCRSELQLWDSVLLGPSLLIANQYFNTVIPEFPLLCVCFVISAVNAVGHAVIVCRQLCGHFRIRCFHLPTHRD